MDVIDLDMGHWFIWSDALSCRVHGGFRYANVAQKIQAVYEYTEGDEAYVTDEPMQCDAYGLRAGGALFWTLYPDNVPGEFHIFARGAISALVGDFKTSNLGRDIDNYSDPGPGDIFIDYDATRNYTRIIPVTEVAVGVEWEYGPFFCSAGYELSVWGNMAERNFPTSSWVPTVIEDVSDLGLDGFFFHLGTYR